jgi:hypothetical protein
VSAIKIKCISLVAALLILAFASFAVANPATNQINNTQDLQRQIPKKLVTLPPIMVCSITSPSE